jgi:hypothetical protein
LRGTPWAAHADETGGELVEIGLADEQRTGALQPLTTGAETPIAQVAAGSCRSAGATSILS